MKNTNQSAQTQIQEAKDIVAKQHGYHNWLDILKYFKDGIMTPVKFEHFENEAMLEYDSLKSANQSAQEVDVDAVCVKCNKRVYLTETMPDGGLCICDRPSLQSKAGGYSLEDMRKAFTSCDAKTSLDTFESFEEFIQSLTPTQSKAVFSLEIELLKWIEEELKKDDEQQSDGGESSGIWADALYTFRKKIQSLTPTPIQTKGREVEKDIEKSVCEHEWTLMADSFDSPYCKKCGKIS